MRSKLGKFGALVKEYKKARRPYPAEVFNFLKKNLTTKDSLILDLGCGTGISTRQLTKYGHVIGCDPDVVMLRAAKKYPKINNEKYVTGYANNLPFKDRTFDVVTAFGAFHWFNDRKSISEIRRVLRPGGIIFIVNKMGLKSWGEGYRRMIIRTIHREVAHFRKNILYKPQTSLLQNRFKKIKIRAWRKSELFSIPNALEYVQSVSIWNSVPALLKSKALDGLKKYFKKMKSEKGEIERKLAVRVVVGTK
ncbi:MAG: class I SAM-dependent methyltransferase [Candidatus Campbellbacteria bacterium]|nr:class I SAM-dependent methyltransferase [Candidatus Campbellbacteria bacterium]